MQRTRRLTRWFGWAAVLGMTALPAEAAAEERHPTTGVFFASIGGVSPGGGSATLHLGGGFETVAYKGLGFGAEVGYLGAAEDMGEGFGVLDVNGYYHFATDSSRKLVPFATGGYTMFFREGSASLFNLGGGIDYRSADRYGFRIEFRDHIWSDYGGSEHFYGFRFGLTFR